MFDTAGKITKLIPRQDSLTSQHEGDEELADELDARFGELEAEIERLEAKRQAYDPADIARCGAFVILNHDGTVRIERGFVRAEDEQPEPEPQAVSGEGEGGHTGNKDGTTVPNGEAGNESSDGEDVDADGHKPLSDSLIRDLTDRSRGPGFSLMPKFCPRAIRRAANLMILTPSTGRGLESQTLFRLKLVGKGALCPTPMNPPEGRHVAAEKVEMMRRNRPIQQNFTRSRTCVYFWFRARVT